MLKFVRVPPGELVIKAAYPVGHISNRKNGTFQKQGDGKWKRISGPKAPKEAAPKKKEGRTRTRQKDGSFKYTYPQKPKPARKKWKALFSKMEAEGAMVPKTESPVEAMYALMRYAEDQKPGGDSGRFPAMDAHNAILDFAAEGGYQAQQALSSLGMMDRISDNQERLGITDYQRGEREPEPEPKPKPKPKPKRNKKEHGVLSNPENAAEIVKMAEAFKERSPDHPISVAQLEMAKDIQAGKSKDEVAANWDAYFKANPKYFKKSPSQRRDGATAHKQIVDGATKMFADRKKTERARARIKKIESDAIQEIIDKRKRPEGGDTDHGRLGDKATMDVVYASFQAQRHKIGGKQGEQMLQSIKRGDSKEQVWHDYEQDRDGMSSNDPDWKQVRRLPASGKKFYEDHIVGRIDKILKDKEDFEAFQTKERERDAEVANAAAAAHAASAKKKSYHPRRSRLSVKESNTEYANGYSVKDSRGNEVLSTLYKQDADSMAHVYNTVSRALETGKLSAYDVNSRHEDLNYEMIQISKRSGSEGRRGGVYKKLEREASALGSVLARHPRRARINADLDKISDKRFKLIRATEDLKSPKYKEKRRKLDRDYNNKVRELIHTVGPKIAGNSTAHSIVGGILPWMHHDDSGYTMQGTAPDKEAAFKKIMEGH